jgi:F-type H+-transporting ATPase subunit epsilon
VTTSAPGQERKRLGVRLLTPEGPVFDDLVRLLDDTELIDATTEGYLSVEEDRVQILTEQAELADEIDRERAQAALEKAQAALEKAQAALEKTQAALADAGDDEVARVAVEAAVRRAENRLRVADR